MVKCICLRLLQSMGEQRMAIMANQATDLEIAQQAKLKHIQDIAESLGLQEDEWEPYGRYKAKLSLTH
ncbi:formate--tetrahydrofolate ligase [Saccharococcus caldoxylosilyticus]|nr:formate--tetrahydrofolate ligase [Parageobacillus caldoxylosilyticus]